ncbi:CDP-glycerol glycerophosphotransferase family protein [Nonomuraea sp. NPDC046570]|uniref:bifunctional glycosyltransferase/CDP-glycerol:glycerophosphate glycerophosphotransferase n=1 Tax=Nonomuraea sp. NPDC046570 TaxID=3155255 RepID=UPI0033FF6D2D
MARLSVVVPIYDVEPYLAACLESLAAQTWRDLQVVMVDEGSPDGSAAVAARFAARDPRFRLIRHDGSGPGAARNAGVGEASGEFLAFVDGDDLVPPHAFEIMAHTLDRTGSDLVTGDVLRFGAGGVRRSAAHRAIFEDAELRTHVTRKEVLLRDRLVTNKLWRRSFWEWYGFAFPEGVPYGDTAVALPGHFLARSVDMLPDPVYLWREREGDGARAPEVEDRIAAIRAVRDFLYDSGRRDHAVAWDVMVLDGDLPDVVQAFPQAEEDFRERFLDLATAYLDDLSPGTLTRLPVLRRLMWHLVGQRDAAKLAEVLDWERRSRPQAVRHGLRYHLDAPPGLPADVLRLRAHDLDLQQRLDDLRWENGRLVVEARVTVRHLPAVRRRQHLFASLVHEGTRRKVRLPVKRTLSVPLGRKGKADRTRDWSGLRFTIDPADLTGEAAGTWHVELTVLDRGMLRRARLAGPTREAAERAGGVRPGPGVSVIPRRTGAGAFALDVRAERLNVTGWTVEDGRLLIKGDLGMEPPAGAQLTVGVAAGVRRVRGVFARAGGGFTAEVELAELVLDDRPPLDPVSAEALEQPRELVVHLGQERLYLPEDLPWSRHRVGEREIVVCASGGVFTLREQRIAASVRGARWSADGVLRLDGRCVLDLGEGVRVVATGQDGVRLFPARTVEGGFEADLAPMAVESPAGCLPLPAGPYALSLRTAAGDLPLEYEPAAPAVGAHHHRELTLASGEDRRAVLTVGGDLKGDERGSANQRRLREERYPLLRDEPLWDAVFYDSQSGTRFSGSPKAVHDELVRRGAPLRHLWNVRDGQVRLPDGVTPVRLNGKEYYEALARSRYVVTDTHLPAWFRRREGQRVLQTWHDSPPECSEGSAAEWDYLISPSPWCTPMLRDAFGFEGRVLEIGHPCGDVLARPELAVAVRERLGLPEGKKVVLYAPAACDDGLDLRRMREELDEDHVLLVRRHPDLARSTGSFVVDVSAHPDLWELYLVADLLVTDYSAAMFDFAVTGRPMLFHTRGPEHPFEAEAPGPLLRTTEEVAEAIRGVEEVNRKYEDLYAAFTARFCPLADGGAAARAVEEVFDLRDVPEVGQEAAWTSPSSSRE